MKKILFIEDNTDVRENTAEILQLANYEVVTAENGRIGVEKAKQCAPDIVICDIMMPEMNGYQVLEELSKNSKTGNVPFIFLTAKTAKSDIRTGMNLGADDYLTKPFEEMELLDAISSRLKKNEFLKKNIAKNVQGLNIFLKEASNYLDFEQLAKEHDLKSFGKGEIIYREGDRAASLYFVESGTIKTFKGTESGKEFVTGIHRAGDFVGQLSLLNHMGTCIETATALDAAEIVAIPKKEFIELLYGNPAVSQKFIGMISNSLIDVQEHLVDMAYATVRQRAAKALLELYHKGIVGDMTNRAIGIPREDLAGLIGTATETAIRTLSDFKDEGLITTDHGRRIILLDIVRLNTVADSA